MVMVMIITTTRKKQRAEIVVLMSMTNGEKSPLTIFGRYRMMRVLTYYKEHN